ncbi:MAG: hypothetical protein JSS24_16230, partial [Proteobacteria bacterium]|nr:hypothetical protein [Pseudomonadota bacterium]
QPVVGVALQRIRTRSRVDGWDGEGSFAVTAGTIAIAEQVIAALERLLPVGIDAPDVFAEADGDIGIEWDIARRLTYWISVNGNGRISFAGLFGSQGADHGWRPLDLSSPRALDRSLDVVVVHVLRLFPSTVGTRAA